MPPTTVLDGSEFAGKTKSFTVLHGGGSWPTCKACGSTLYPQRRESAKVRTIGGSRLNVDANGDTAYFWTREAEGALDMNALRHTDPADMN